MKRIGADEIKGKIRDHPCHPRHLCSNKKWINVFCVPGCRNTVTEVPNPQMKATD